VCVESSRSISAPFRALHLKLTGAFFAGIARVEFPPGAFGSVLSRMEKLRGQYMYIQESSPIVTMVFPEYIYIEPVRGRTKLVTRR
jgi:hypothetical protein